MVEQPEPFAARMIGPHGLYELAFTPDRDEGVIEARLPGGALRWIVEVCERDGAGWRLCGLTRGTQAPCGDTYWFELRTAAPARVEYYRKTLVRTDYEAA